MSIPTYFIVMIGLGVTRESIPFGGDISLMVAYLLVMFMLIFLGSLCYDHLKKPHKVLKFYFRYRKIFTNHKINSVHDIHCVTNGVFGDVDTIKAELRLLMSQGLVSGIKTHSITPFGEFELKEWEF